MTYMVGWVNTGEGRSQDESTARKRLNRRLRRRRTGTCNQRAALPRTDGRCRELGPGTVRLVVAYLRADATSPRRSPRPSGCDAAVPVVARGSRDHLRRCGARLCDRPGAAADRATSGERGSPACAFPSGRIRPRGTRPCRNRVAAPRSRVASCRRCAPCPR